MTPEEYQSKMDALIVELKKIKPCSIYYKPAVKKIIDLHETHHTKAI